MRRGNMAGAMQYVPELTWILFLRIFDERETQEQVEAEALSLSFTPSLSPPYRWQDWADPEDEQRKQLESGKLSDFFAFVDQQLIPYLKHLKNQPEATVKQKVISEIMSGVERVRIDTERNFLDVLDRVHQISHEDMDSTHVFALSQVYEGLLLRMGEKNNDGGQFFTPREVIRAMVKVIDPKVGETVYDPGCGTGGFLAEAYEHIRKALDATATAEDLETLKECTFYGREKKNLIYPIALANLVLHGIDYPHLWHGNTLTNHVAYGGLFEGAPPLFEVILTNPPFGGKEGKDAQTPFDYKTSATQVLFLQHVIKNLTDGGRCGIVVDEGLLFRTNEDAFVKTKRKLLDECDLWCIVSLPAGVFTQAGAGVKTNLLFFTKGRPTERIWYYDLSDEKITKKKPLVRVHFEEFIQLLPERGDSGHSWTVDFAIRKRQAAETARPLHEQAHAKRQQVAQLREKLVEFKKLDKQSPDLFAPVPEVVTGMEQRLRQLTQEANELAGKATDIENAVYDLKAVNPNRKPATDTRTPEELLALIEAKGREIAEALALLRARNRP
jgi:type I restriction enzyme M protein